MQNLIRILPLVKVNILAVCWVSMVTMVWYGGMRCKASVLTFTFLSGFPNPWSQRRAQSSSNLHFHFLGGFPRNQRRAQSSCNRVGWARDALQASCFASNCCQIDSKTARLKSAKSTGIELPSSLSKALQCCWSSFLACVVQEVNMCVWYKKLTCVCGTRI